MRRDDVYGVLLHLYPGAFRREYETELRQTFAQVSAAHRGSAARFWLGIVGDLLRSGAREHWDVWTNGQSRLGLQWLVACVVGTATSGVAIVNFLIAVEFFFPTTFGPDHVAHNISRNLPTGVYGAIIGAVIGVAQASVVQKTLRRRVAYIVATVAGGGAGIPLGFVFASLVAKALHWTPGSDVVRQVSYFSGVLVLGALVGLAQSVALRLGVQSAIRWMASSAVAICGAIAFALALTTFITTNLRTWSGVAFVFLAWPAMIGIVIGALTVRPLTRLLSAGE